MTVSEARVILTDFGEAYNPTSEGRLGKDCRTPLASRPPEAEFEPELPLSYSADIWSLAVAIWNILGIQIFSDFFSTEDDVLSQHVERLGILPKTWWDGWEARSQYFDAEGGVKKGRQTHGSIEQEFESRVQSWRRERNIGDFDKDEAAAILSLMRRMLAFRPEDRPTCDEVLQSEWMVKWALPELERVKALSVQ
jgi:serine/threonine-protein kinase SRPK3